MTIYFYTSLFFLLISSYFFIKKNFKEYYILLSIVLIIISSFRWNVGGDWETYLIVYERANYDLLKFNWSFIFELINFIFNFFNLGIFFVNVFISSLFFYSLYKLCNNLKFDILLALLIAFSLIYFNGIMGYVRQTLALTFLIFSLDFYFRNKVNNSILFFVLGVLTHVSLLIFIPLYLYVFKNHKFKILILITVIFILLILNLTNLITYYEQFIQKSYISSGTILRLFPVLLCNLFIILNYKKIFYNFSNLNIFLIYSIFVTTSFILFIIIFPNNSASIDRLNFYFVSYQLIAIGTIFSKVLINHRNYLHYVNFVSLFYFCLLFIWMIFGDYSIYWFKYRFIF